MNITVVGAGYVGLANAFIMGMSKEVKLLDIDKEKIKNLRDDISPINDEYINKYIKKVRVDYTTDKEYAYKDAKITFLAVDTSYDERSGSFNLSSIDKAMEDISIYMPKGGIIVIKSTIPSGYTKTLQTKYEEYTFLFSPEFLREGYALYDNMNPDRLIIGSRFKDKEQADLVSKLLLENIETSNVPVLFLSNEEAEMIKLFANTYLAMRVAFVNEVDSFCQKMDMKTKNVLDGIGYDKRIGFGYFNPSFGYGGYCLPKDTKQLRNEYKKNDIEQSLIESIVRSNEVRKNHIVFQIEKAIQNNLNKTIGFYRIISKKGINNFRSSATLDVAIKLKEKGYKIVIYEPFLTEEIEGMINISDIKEFENNVDIIVANRKEPEIINLSKTIYTTDIYEEY